MSRYVRLELAVASLDEVREALRVLKLPVEGGSRKVMLQGSLECAGEPVDLRIPAGELGTVEDFGFVIEPQQLRLVCGELDRRLLEQELVPALHQSIGEARVRAAAEQADLEIAEIKTELDGSRRLILRQK